MYGFPHDWFEMEEENIGISVAPTFVSSGSKFELNEINFLFLFFILSMYIISPSGSPTYVLYVIVHA